MCGVTCALWPAANGRQKRKTKREKPFYAATLAAILANFRMPTKGRRRFGGINCKATNGSSNNNTAAAETATTATARKARQIYAM